VLVTGPYFMMAHKDPLGCHGPLQQRCRLAESYLDPDIQPLALTEGDIDDLVAFLGRLTSVDYKGTKGSRSWRASASCPDDATAARHGEAFGPKPPQPKPQALILTRALLNGETRTPKLGGAKITDQNL